MISGAFAVELEASRALRAGADSLTDLVGCAERRFARQRGWRSRGIRQFHADDESTNMGSLMGKARREGGWMEKLNAQGGAE